MAVKRGEHERNLAAAFGQEVIKILNDHAGESVGLIASSAGTAIVDEIIATDPWKYVADPSNPKLNCYQNPFVDGRVVHNEARWSKFVRRHVTVTEKGMSHPPLLAATKLKDTRIMLHLLGTPPPRIAFISAQLDTQNVEGLLPSAAPERLPTRALPPPFDYNVPFDRPVLVSGSTGAGKGGTVAHFIDHLANSVCDIDPQFFFATGKLATWKQWATALGSEAKVVLISGQGQDAINQLKELMLFAQRVQQKRKVNQVEGAPRKVTFVNLDDMEALLASIYRKTSNDWFPNLFNQMREDEVVFIISMQGQMELVWRRLHDQPHTGLVMWNRNRDKKRAEAVVKESDYSTSDFLELWEYWCREPASAQEDGNSEAAGGVITVVLGKVRLTQTHEGWSTNWFNKIEIADEKVITNGIMPDDAKSAVVVKPHAMGMAQAVLPRSFGAGGGAGGAQTPPSFLTPVIQPRQAATPSQTIQRQGNGWRRQCRWSQEQQAAGHVRAGCATSASTGTSRS